MVRWFSILGVILCSTGLQAAVLISAPHLSLAALDKAFKLSSPQGQAALPMQLLLVHTRLGVNQVYHMRLQQQYHGVPVYGGLILLHSPHPFKQTFLSHPAVRFTGHLYQDLETDLGNMPPDFQHQGATRLLQMKIGYAPTIVRKAHVQPMIYVDRENKAHWAYKMSVLLAPAHGMPSEPTMIVDALTQTTYLSWDNLKTTKMNVLGMGYGGNARTGKVFYSEEKPALQMKRDSHLHRCYLENNMVKVIDMHRDYQQERSAFSFSCVWPDPHLLDHYWTGLLSNGFDEVNQAFSPSNDALYFATLVKEAYNNWYHVEPFYYASGRTARLIMRVHYGELFTNAFWDGEGVTFGDGDLHFYYPLVSLAITAHEISHGFTQQHANLEYVGQSGAINESFSDMAGIVVEAYAAHPITWRIGGDVLKLESGREAIRFMDHPSQDGKSFESVQAYEVAAAEAERIGKSVEVHRGSGVFNRLFYLLSTSPGWSIKRAFGVMVHANMNYWTPFSDFQDAACGILYAAQDLGEDLLSLHQSLEQIGLTVQGCSKEKGRR